MTTFEPGARLAFTQGLVFKPFSTAFLASSPAATITEGFDVLVQLVIAAITTEPFVIERRRFRRLLDVAARRRRPPSRPPSEANRSMTGNERGRRLLGGPGRLQLFEGGLKRRLRVMQAARGPAAAAGRPGSARRSRDPARACRNTRPRANRPCGTCPVPWHKPRPA